MSSVKDLYRVISTVTIIVAGSLLISSLAPWINLGEKTGRFLSSIYFILAAMGVIWLSRHWLRLAGGITSVTSELKSKGCSAVKSSDNVIIDQLCGIINRRLKNDHEQITHLQERIKDLELGVQLAQRQERHTEAIIYSIRDAVIAIDEFDKVLMANEAAGKLFNFDFSNCRHKPINELIGTDEIEFADFLRQSRRARARHKKRELEFSKNGQVKTFDCIVSCVYDREQVTGAVAVLHDITRKKEISQMKNDFVSHVSHELKTPLASITAYSEMLCDGEAQDEQTRKEFYSVIQSQADRLNRLIEDILNISRIESGLIKVDKKPVSLAILIEEQLQMIKGYAEEKNIEIISQTPIVFDQVYVDRDMISQVIVNLLSNAVKYTLNGGSVRIETEVDEEAGVGRVSVIDTGVGIPEDEIEHIFEKFYRVSSNKACANGTGLGLTFVKHIVEKVHGGRVFVKSQPGVGSTFGFELPLAKASEAEVIAVKQRSA